MTTYHYSPDVGDTRPCTSPENCKFGGLHTDDLQKAQKYAEDREQQEAEVSGTSAFGTSGANSPEKDENTPDVPVSNVMEKVASTHGENTASLFYSEYSPNDVPSSQSEKADHVHAVAHRGIELSGNEDTLSKKGKYAVEEHADRTYDDAYRATGDPRNSLGAAARAAVLKAHEVAHFEEQERRKNEA